MDGNRNWLIGQKQFIHMPQSHAQIRKLPVRDHMAHMVKINILTGQEEIGYLHFILNIIFHCKFTEKNNAFSQNLYSLL